MDDLFVEILPQDGTPLQNQTMRLMLSREVQRSISPNEYAKIRDRLVGKGVIKRAIGPGGKVCLVPNGGTPLKSKPRTSKENSEAALMLHLGNFLESRSAETFGQGACTECIVEDTSTKGPRQGRWVRPDYILVTVSRFRFVPQRQVDLHSFELKTEVGGDVPAVHEALAQTRYTHFGHVVWHLPIGSPYEKRLPDVRSQCISHGIGLILMRRLSDPPEMDIVVAAEHQETPPSVVDGFLEARLSEQNRIELERLVGNEQ